MHRRALYSLALSVLLAGCARPAAPPAPVAVSTSQSVAVNPPAASAPAATAVVARQDIELWKNAPGTVTAPPNKTASVAPTFQGQVTRVFVSLGQTVHSGDVLCTLANPQTDAAYQEAQSEVKQAQAAWRQAHETYQATLQQVRQRVSQARQAERDDRVAVAQDQKPVTTMTHVAPPPVAVVPSAAPAPDVAVASPSDEPSVQVLGQRTQPPQVRVTTQIAHPERLTLDQEKLQQATRTRQQAELAYTQAMQQVDSNLLPYTQKLADAQLRLKQAEATKKLEEIKTPISGQVVALDVAANATVQTGKPVATIVDLDALKLVGSVRQSDGNALTPGTAVKVTFPSLPHQILNGRVAQRTLSPGRPAWTVMLSFDNPKGVVKPQTPGNFSWLAAAAHNALAIPVRAVQKQANGSTVVTVSRDNAWQTQPVTLGVSNGQEVEVVSGLSEGDVVQLH